MVDSETRERVCLGVITGAQGIRGEVRVRVFATDADALAAYGPLEDENGSRHFEIERMRPAKDAMVVKFAGTGDRNQAEALKGTRLYVARAALPEPGEEEWYHADLVGLAVETADGEKLGTVSGIHDFGAGDLVEVARDDGAASELVPFTRENVPVVDVAGGRLVVVLPEVMEDDEGAEEGR
jgi:16S rRNA processing protein RimM